MRERQRHFLYNSPQKKRNGGDNSLLKATRLFPCTQQEKSLGPSRFLLLPPFEVRAGHPEDTRSPLCSSSALTATFPIWALAQQSVVTVLSTMLTLLPLPPCDATGQEQLRAASPGHVVV